VYVYEEYQFCFRRGKGARDAVGMLTIMSKRTSEIDEKAFDL
jgi:hypothetical protein